jgi:hypothetical protein
MMATEINNFLLSLAAAIAAATSPAPLHMKQDKDDATAAALWIHNAEESKSAPVYTVLRIYGGTDDGNFPGARVLSALVQADTRGRNDDGGVIAQAWAVHDSLRRSDGAPQMHWAVPGKAFDADGAIIDDPADPNGDWEVRIVKFNGAPGIVGVDEAKRSIATANYEIEFQRA